MMCRHERDLQRGTGSVPGPGVSGNAGTILGGVRFAAPYPRPLRHHLRLVVLAIMLASPLVGAATHPGKGGALEPAAGMLLVAARGLGDPNFARTVVLLVQHTESGSLGLVLNRPVPHTLQEALPELAPEAGDSPFLFFGGPVGLDSLMFLFRTDTKSDDALTIIRNTHLGADRALLEERLRTAPDYASLRVFIGHAGWAPGQLAREIARGDWHLHAATEDAVWSPTAGDLWHELIEGDVSNGQLVLHLR